jgi:D-glycero-D-manno-heptose 1,7-bisphosphate phosphatase
MTTAVFLDRDGTLNVEKGYIRTVEDLVLIPGTAKAIKHLNEQGILAILTTNQTGAARGFYDLSHIEALNQRVAKLLFDEANAHLDAVFYCPHLSKSTIPEFAIECLCRKPQTGMIEMACKQFQSIDLESSYVIGDKASDVMLAKNAGCKSILVKTGYGEKVLAGQYQVLTDQPDWIANNTAEAIENVIIPAAGKKSVKPIRN